MKCRTVPRNLNFYWNNETRQKISGKKNNLGLKSLTRVNFLIFVSDPPPKKNPPGGNHEILCIHRTGINCRWRRNAATKLMYVPITRSWDSAGDPPLSCMAQMSPYGRLTLLEIPGICHNISGYFWLSNNDVKKLDTNHWLTSLHHYSTNQWYKGLWIQVQIFADFSIVDFEVSMFENVWNFYWNFIETEKNTISKFYNISA